ncbi:MAG TPA: MBL fold metallo-hydrolase [Anaerolineales bacterium]|nr:MBL fold metallo-hydrolase [Anaerolineales bacterium]
MPKLIFLGTSNAIPDENHENTHMVLVGKERTVLIDCVNSPILRLRKVGVEFDHVTDMILTHFHPDHVSGVPQLLMNMWLMGRRQPLTVYGLHHTLDRVESLMGFYGWSEWPNFFPVVFCRLPIQDTIPVLECDEFAITAIPVQHFIPTIGLRMEFLKTKKVVAYSCDTQPCPQVLRLAEGADILIHEASGPVPGHSSAAQAGEAARKAEVGALYLIHYPTAESAPGDPVGEARKEFPGPITLAEDYMPLNLD